MSFFMDRIAHLMKNLPVNVAMKNLSVVIAMEKENAIHRAMIEAEENSDWNQVYKMEKEIYGDSMLDAVYENGKKLDMPVWYAKHPRFMQVLFRENIIERIVPRQGQYRYRILVNEAMLYDAWQIFFKDQMSAESFFYNMLGNNGKPITKERINNLRKNQGKNYNHALPGDVIDKLSKALHREPRELTR